MAILSREDLQKLIENSDGPAVSIFQPTHRTGDGIQQDPIRFKNLLREAEGRLIETGMRGAEASAMLDRARRLLDDEMFWQHQSDGLAAFVSRSSFRYFRLPYRFDELVVIGERFHVKPLLRVLSEDGRFYVLAISGKDVRLLQGTRHSVAEVDLANVPHGLLEALRFDDPEKQLQFHTFSQGAAAIFHGHAGGTDAGRHKKDLLRYFQQVDRGLHELLKSDRAPLVLAGVEYLLPIYREANTYTHLLERGVTGNPDLLDARELHDRAWEIVEPFFRRAREERAARYHDLLGTGLASHDLREIVPAAYHGRIDALFVTVGVQQWGHFAEADGVVEVHESYRNGDRDLLDLAAVQTMLHGGMVFAVSADEVPDEGSPAAAIFRY